MPKYSIISPIERRDWLEKHEKGVPLDAIAREAKRDQRTVKSNLERAHLERDFEVAQREQLREALRSHQEDMLGLVGRLIQAAQTQQLTLGLIVSPDLGLEDLLSAEELSAHCQVPLGTSLVSSEVFPGKFHLASIDQEGSSSVISVLRDAEGPNQVILAEEGSILWRAVKEHIGSRDPLWNLISHWKRDLLGDCQATASLNRGARNRAEEEFGIPVLWGSGHPEPHLAAPLVRWAITAASRVTRGEKACDVVEEVRDVGGGRLEAVNGLLIAMGMETSGDWKVKLRKMAKEMAVSSELEDAMMARQKLQQVTGNLHGALEEYLLIHHLPGRCSLCRKLGG